ncbi:tight adherence protein B [Arcanobacterium wilhelmae]|uniref:Tight adherence protein B n=1 Tax=Arcanobacterium wilhelmae TaxID=1803177 RepID=A0ABT9NCN8_9ACTO|nr:type II secretion system F family protein [Arcanobacterium wilhelmae]MDP9801492.1 tight adherence protein B [Arcanobacterium wilhelmae]WFN90823.1 type II secretion system F family protein [Arcanobacterium wilhelmae]
MGFAVGSLIGLGLFIAGLAIISPRPAVALGKVQAVARREATGFASALGAFLVSFLIVGSAVFSIVVAVAGGFVPRVLRERSRRRRVEAMRAAWPEALDEVVSAVRSGLSVGEALGGLGTRGPDILKEPFAHFAYAVRASGRLDLCLDDVKAKLADPLADRVIEAMRIAAMLGGADLGKSLSTLAALVREENRARGELLARQSWTTNGARLAACAPWILLALLATREGTLEAYSTPTGVAVLVGGFIVTVGAYLLMVRLGRLPAEERILTREVVA